jgi:hypothetical protein
MSYKEMLEGIRARLFIIEELSLIDDRYNAEWQSLKLIENELYKLEKLNVR